MPIEEGVAFFIGDIEVDIQYYLSLPDEGETGARSNALTVGDTGITADRIINELQGKLGAAIGPYDPEGKNRLIQEF